VIRRLLVDDATDTGVVVAITAADGTLLWVEGDPKAIRKVESMNFVPGADWSERRVGTNAPGTALALDHELQIRSSEHFSRVAQPWSCTAAPVHDPATGDLIGAIDLTGGIEVASAQALALVRATAVAVENHLALLRLTEPRARGREQASAQLRVLGAERPRWQFTDQRSQRRTAHLTPRHADILVLLSQHPEGLSADRLAMMLDDKDLDVVTGPCRDVAAQTCHCACHGGVATVSTAGTGRQRRESGVRRTPVRAGRLRAGPLPRRTAAAVDVTCGRAVADGAEH
jgi:hypothetical protein